MYKSFTLSPSSQNFYTTKFNTFWVGNLIVISGYGQFKLKNIELVEQVTVIKNIYHMCNEKIDYYYLHLEAPVNDKWTRISIGSKCITKLRYPDKAEELIYKLEFEDSHVVHNHQPRVNRWDIYQR